MVVLSQRLRPAHRDRLGERVGAGRSRWSQRERGGCGGKNEASGRDRQSWSVRLAERTTTSDSYGAARKRSPIASPATQAISPAASTTGTRSRSSRGTLLSVNRSCSVFVP